MPLSWVCLMFSSRLVGDHGLGGEKPTEVKCRSPHHIQGVHHRNSLSLLVPGHLAETGHQASPL